MSRPNISSYEGIIRITLAVVILMLWMFDVINGSLLIVLGVMAVASVITAFTGYCPVYAIFGFSTCKTEK